MMRSLGNIAGRVALVAVSVYPASAAFAGESVGEGRGREHPQSARPAVVEEAAAIAPATQPADNAKADGAAPLTTAQVNVTETGAVDLHVNDASLAEVLRMLSLQSQKNIVASKEVRGTVTANLYGVTIHEALDAILHANGCDYREKGNFIYVYSAKELADLEKASRKKATEVVRLYYTPAASAVNMLKPVLSPEGQVAFTAASETGIDSDAKAVGGNGHSSEDVIVITDYPENLQAARNVLKELDRRPQQILIEATILKADLNENNSLGIDFTALGGVNFGALSAVNGSTPELATGLSQALSGDIQSNTAAGKIADKGYIGGSVGGGGLQLGIVKNSIGMFIQALEGVTDTVVLANPKVLVLNKQKGEVHVGEDQGYRTAITTETTTASNVNFLQTGTRLIFRPYVGDNGYIRLEIHPEDSNGTVDPTGVPSKSVTEITSNVMVKDGNTIVIGGLFRESTSRIRSQVPGLGSLPGIGAAFRQQTDATTREEVIILLTPHIIKDDQAYSEASERQMNEVERLRVGMRQGLMPWGRERLAESWYDAATAEMNKPAPDREKALFHLNCAINLNPLFAEAIELRSQVSGREMQAMDNSTIRSFVKRQILAERAAAKGIDHPATQPAARGPDDGAPVRKARLAAEKENAGALPVGPFVGPDSEMFDMAIPE
ncbi:MAG TPA: secretin and TonB N-terminal domain-containing protein [Tepidisphaeraceae bacterium]|jgi:type IV pilus assembly protein PilQ|nr:secretin and TonB N-terminal domain-containing protein [Tepidisphaeraceae bacterium]